MARRSTVYEVVGDIMGDIMGEVGEGSVFEEFAQHMGHTAASQPAPAKSWRNGAMANNGNGRPLLGGLDFNHPAVRAAVQHIAASGMQNVQVPQRPQWRDGQAAPGVMLPDEGMVPLGMSPDDGTGTFTATSPGRITWVGRMQKPFRAERLLVSSVRTGATATGRALGQFFVGVDLNQGTLQPVDIELFGSAQAFGTRLTLLQAPPGIELQIPVSLSSTPTGTDSVFLTIAWAGRIVH